MSAEDDLLSSFFAEIDKLPTSTTSTPKEEKVKIAIYSLAYRMLL